MAKTPATREPALPGPDVPWRQRAAHGRPGGGACAWGAAARWCQRYQNVYTRHGVVEKPIVWMGSSLVELRGFPREARRRAGHQLHLVQLGLEPDDSKPMPSVGPGVHELRIHTGVEHRVLYVAKFREAVYVLHAFEKRTRKTPRPALDLARQRLGALMAARARGEGR